MSDFWDRGQNSGGSNDPFWSGYKESTDFTSRYDEQKKKDEEEQRRAAEEQAKIDAEKNKSFFQKAKDYVFNQANFVKNNPAQAAKNVGHTFVSGIEAAAADIAAPFEANIYNKTNEKIFQQQQEMDNRLISKIKNTTDPTKKQKLLEVLNKNRDTNSQIDVFKDVPELNKTPVQVYADFAAMGLDMFGFAAAGAGIAKAGGQALLKSGVKGFGVNLIKAAGADAGEALAKQTFFRSVLEGAGWGAGYGGTGAAQQGGNLQDIERGAITGAIVGAAIPTAIGGVSEGVKFIKNAPMNKVRNSLVTEYDRHLVNGVTDARLATELLKNGEKSIKVSSSLPESLVHLGQDLAKKEELMATVEGQRALASTVVNEAMSRNTKRTIYREIVDSGLFKIEKGDSVDSVIQKGVDSVLANGKEVRGSLKMTSQYADSVLGVINPQLKEVEDTIAQKAAGEVSDQTELQKINQKFVDATTPPEKPVQTQPEAAKIAPDEVSAPKGVDGQPAVKTEQKFPEKTGVARKISDDLMNSEKAAQVYTELETAQAGFRKAGPDGTTISGKSTFPEWVPNEYVKENGTVVSLRDRKLFDQVQEHFINGTVPTDERQLALYDVVHNELRKRMDLPAVEFPTEGKILKAQRLSPEKPVKVETDEKAISAFSKRYNDLYNPDTTPTTHDIAHNDAQIKKALELTRVDYDRAKRIATGIEKSDDVLTNATAMAVLDKARAEGDRVTEKLVLERTIARTTRAGQEIQITSKLASVDPAYDAVKEVRAVQNKAFEAKTGEKVGIATDKTIKEIDSHIKPVTSDKFAQFIKDHPC